MNKRMLLKSIIPIGLLVATGFAYSQNPQPAPAPHDLCPTADQLVKKDLLWGASGGWVSYGESFDKQVLGFVKVEWIGINVGKIICIYKGDRKFAFPIALEQKHNNMAQSPAGYHWTRDLGGRKECVSNNVKDCPFTFEKPEEQGDIYQNLDFFKGKSDDNF